MKTIIRPGRPIYENRLKYGRFRCQACGCEFTADAGDIEYTDLYGCGDVVERDPFSHCPNCGKAALFENGEWEKVRRTEPGYVTYGRDDRVSEQSKPTKDDGIFGSLRTELDKTV